MGTTRWEREVAKCRSPRTNLKNPKSKISSPHDTVDSNIMADIAQLSSALPTLSISRIEDSYDIGEKVSVVV